MALVTFVKEWERLVCFRFGRFAGLKGPGLVITADRAVRVDTRTEALVIPSATVTTKDDLPIEIDLLVLMHVDGDEAEKAVMEVEDYHLGVVDLAGTVVRRLVADIRRDDVPPERLLSEMIRRRLDWEARRWGVRVTQVEIGRLSAPDGVPEATSGGLSAKAGQTSPAEAKSRRWLAGEGVWDERPSPASPTGAGAKSRRQASRRVPARPPPTTPAPTAAAALTPTGEGEEAQRPPSARPEPPQQAREPGTAGRVLTYVFLVPVGLWELGRALVHSLPSLARLLARDARWLWLLGGKAARLLLRQLIWVPRLLFRAGRWLTSETVEIVEEVEEFAAPVYRRSVAAVRAFARIVARSFQILVRAVAALLRRIAVALRPVVVLLETAGRFLIELGKRILVALRAVARSVALAVRRFARLVAALARRVAVAARAAARVAALAVRFLGRAVAAFAKRLLVALRSLARAVGLAVRAFARVLAQVARRTAVLLRAALRAALKAAVPPVRWLLRTARTALRALLVPIRIARHAIRIAARWVWATVRWAYERLVLIARTAARFVRLLVRSAFDALRAAVRSMRRLLRTSCGPPAARDPRSGSPRC